MAYKYGYVEGGAPQASGGADPLDAFVASQGAAADPLDAFVASQGGIAKTGMPAAQAAPQAEPRTAFGETARQVGLTGRAAVTGLTALPTMAGDALNSLINAGTGGVNRIFGTNIPQLQMPSEVTQNAMNAAGVPQPQNATERVVQDVAGAMAGAGGQARLGQALMQGSPGVASRIGATLATAPGMQILGAAGGAVAQGAAREGGAGMPLQLAAGLAGSALPIVGASMATRALANRQIPQARPIEARVEPTLGQQEPAFNIDISGTSQPTPGQLAAELTPRPTNVAPNASQLGNALAANEADIGLPAQQPAARGIRLRTTQAAAPVNTEPFEVPTLPAPKTSLPVPEQQANIDTMNKIGLNSQRPSAITGDKFTAGQEYQQAKLDSPVGEVLRDQLQNEQGAIKNYALGIVKNTGATTTAPEAVGQSIRSPLRDLSQHYDDAITALYNEADKRAGDAGKVVPAELEKLLKNADFRETLLAQDKQGLLGSIERQLKRFQGLIPGSEQAPNTVRSAESFRQWLNKQWTPENSAIIGQVKEALDSDVAKTGGGDLYKLGRALHAERKNTLDNPNGIASLLQERGPAGINQLVPDEKIGAKLLSMPTNQFKHVVNTLKNAPEGLQPQAQQALAEIKGVLAEKIRLAGDKGGNQSGPSLWNAADVTRELNKQNSKLSLIFSPEEMDNFQTLNRAGHILQTPSAYPGAAVQGHNLMQRGFIMAPSAAATALGAHVGGPLGAAGGAALGAALSRKAALAVDKKMAQKLAEELLSPKALLPK